LPAAFLKLTLKCRYLYVQFISPAVVVDVSVLKFEQRIWPTLFYKR